MEEVASIEEKSGREGGEVAPALISVHPLERFVAVAIGPELRVFDLETKCPTSLVDETGSPSHSHPIRAICFGAKGQLFASAGDDKLVKMWKTDSWHCVRTVYSEKRVSAVAISHDGLFVTFADKFGVVWIVGLGEDMESEAAVRGKPIPLLGHYCSIITSLEFSLDGRFIASADRDFKIRTTIFPRRPIKGAHEIQSFCLGHTEFVSCLAFICPPDHPQGLLLSGSGDATVRLWDFCAGCLLDTCEVGAKAGLVVSNGTESETYPAVTDIAASPDGSLVAVSIQSLNGVVLLKCDFSARTLAVAKTVSMEESFVPTSIGLSSSAKRLWMVMGASNLLTTGPTQLLARLRIVSGLQQFVSDPLGEHMVLLKDSEVPGGDSLLLKLQGSLDAAKEEEKLAAAAAAVKAAMQNLLIKKQYSVEKRESRKKSRNDRKQKH